MSDIKELIIESKKHGKFVVLYDAEDEELVETHTWHVVHKSASRDRFVYARTMIKQHATCLHHLIMSTPEGMHTDHINGDPLDNRKENLRICTHAENQHNYGPQKNSILGLKGVYADRRVGRTRVFIAEIRALNKRYYLGRYPTAEEAARAYDAKAKELHGEFAHLNFPDE